jgi:hypothetical protein
MTSSCIREKLTTADLVRKNKGSHPFPVAMTGLSIAGTEFQLNRNCPSFLHVSSCCKCPIFLSYYGPYLPNPQVKTNLHLGGEEETSWG